MQVRQGVRFHKSIWLWMGVLPAFMISENHSYAFPTQDELSAGILALRYKRSSRYWFRFDSGGVDSRTRTSPPDSVYLDRKVENFFVAGAEASLQGGRLGVRGNLKAFHTLQKGEEEEPPKSPREHELTTLKPSVDVTWVNHKGLELIAGLEVLSILRESSKISTSAADSDIKYEPVTLFAGRAGIMKRGSSWSGGFYYGHWKDSTRTFTKESSDGTSQEGISHVLIPSGYGIVGEFSWQDVQFEFDLGSVQAGDGGERTSSGNLVRDDYLKIYCGAFLPVSQGMGIRSGLSHQTLSYADNAYASAETIPMSSLRISMIYGDIGHYLFAGLIFGYGTGGTDITEYKARFKTQALALSMGLFMPL